MSLLGEETHLLEDPASLYEVCLSGGLADTVDRDDLILLYVVRGNCHEIVSVGFLELYVDCVGLELEAYSQP